MKSRRPTITNQNILGIQQNITSDLLFKQVSNLYLNNDSHPISDNQQEKSISQLNSNRLELGKVKEVKLINAQDLFAG